MESSLKMNPKMVKMFPMLPKTGSWQKVYRLKITISCKANELAMLKQKTNFYQVLSLSSENVGFDEIKKAYRSMALQYHPDVCPPSTKEESTERFVEIRKAYETLSDPVSRRIYDYELGVVNLTGFGFQGIGMEGRKNSFPKAVWEKQLDALKQRSQLRMERKNNKFM